MKNAKSYLKLISQHLQEQRAVVLVGSGFSRNADKVRPNANDFPIWADLARIFKEKLYEESAGGEEDPLKLAEYIENAYGRTELDRLLLKSIPDSEYVPSQLHRKLLQLPWSDIFTTNYDTLLERASQELTERSFSYIFTKNDLLGSSGSTRIIKLHGSFPSQRPFIITAEDYRTYPQKFAPFVNTVQQALLENTLCMIGFSGDDPNFNNWIGWIRDNLGAENAPFIYLLLHKAPSDTRREWLRKRNIIAVDLSEIFPEEPAFSVYEKALDYLLDQYRSFKETRYKWSPVAPIDKKTGKQLSVREALSVLQKNRETCPDILTLSGSQIDFLRSVVIRPSKNILTTHCRQTVDNLDIELSYLYECDWLHTRAHLPLHSGDVKHYQEILDRHKNEKDTCKGSIQLSILRYFREHAAWGEWERLHQELCTDVDGLTKDQLNHLCWEECLCSLARFEFQRLKDRLVSWNVSPEMHIWALRKAGLWAEYGECEQAHSLLEQAILDIRKRMTSQKPELMLLSIESAMMYLQSYISQAYRYDDLLKNRKDENHDIDSLTDEKHRMSHKQFRISWEDRNAYYVPRLESPWERYRPCQTEATFDFGRTTTRTVYREDSDYYLALTFLRFREDTGVPFRIRSVCADTEAACGAAKRIAEYYPELAILSLVRADEPEKVEHVITRGVLSTWSMEDTDDICGFYIEAVARTEQELEVGSWFYRNSFARLAADVLPEVLSELCSKCSENTLNRLLDLLEKLYASPKKLCYQRTPSLLRRLLRSYPPSERDVLAMRLIAFPVTADSDECAIHYFPDPFQYMTSSSDSRSVDRTTPIPVIETYMREVASGQGGDRLWDRIFYALCHGLLTLGQKVQLRDMIWQGDRLNIPNKWPHTICLELPLPDDVDVGKYLADHYTEMIEGYAGKNGIRANNDEMILHELLTLALRKTHAFSSDQISKIIAAFSCRVISLANSPMSTDDFMGSSSLIESQLYGIARALWLLTADREDWIPSEKDKVAMENLLAAYERSNIHHHGLMSVWLPILDCSFCAEKNIEKCLRSPDDNRVYYAYDALAFAIRNADLNLLKETEIREGIAIMAQQIAWCIPRQIAAALQIAAVVVQCRPELLSSNIIELILMGLSQMISQTVIVSDDTAETAGRKGEIRKGAASLAKVLRDSSIVVDSETINTWMEIMQDSNEFSEVRYAQ